MFIDARAPKQHPLFLWNITSFYRLYAKYAITPLLSAICITTHATDFYVSHFATGLRQLQTLATSPIFTCRILRQVCDRWEGPGRCEHGMPSHLREHTHQQRCVCLVSRLTHSFIWIWDIRLWFSTTTTVLS